MIDYISVNDIENHSNLTQSEFFHHADLSSAGWAFFSNNLKVIIGRIEDDGLFRGFAVYKYRGWMGLFRRDDALRIIDDGEALISAGRPLELDGIQAVYYPYPFKGKQPPNRLIGYWGYNYYIESTDPEDWLAYPYFKEVVQEDSSRSDLKVMNELLKSISSGKIAEPDFFETLSKKYHTESEYEIAEQSFHVKLPQLGISKESLASLEREIKSRATSSEGKKPQKNIDTVIERLYRSSPHSRSDVLWNRLRNDVEAEDNEKIYDIDLVILEMGEQEIVWQNQQGGTTTMARQTFKNRLSNMRNKK
ncbi:MAG: hypothetical protein CENE_02282 [Candidatus Celerinatantimonas neptuna]|nr:MAG: hypothetical protein CENE_02282 [Candidatus Celerinatantimonas neptuna]